MTQYKLECHFVGGYGQTGGDTYIRDNPDELGSLEASQYRQYAGWSGGCVYSTIEETPTLTPPPSELPNIDLKVLRINTSYAILSWLPIQSIWEKLEVVLKPFGWYVPLMVAEGNQIVIYLGERGSVSLLAIIGIILGVLALFGLISFSWSVIERDKTIQEAENTEQDVVDGLTRIVDNPILPQDIREAAAQKLIEIASPTTTQPPQLPSKESGVGGFLGGIGSGAILALAAVYLLSRKK